MAQVNRKTNALNNLGLYRALARFSSLNYRAKIILVAFLGTHVPLLAIIGFYVANTSRDAATIWGTLIVALIATLAGTGVTLFVLNGLLAPVLLTSRALRAYRSKRELIALPTEFTDEAGTLMADAGATLTQLDATLTELETIDTVSGLANRDKFLGTVDKAIAAKAPFAVAVIRVANFARLRATYDQQEADVFIRALAGRLVEAARLSPDVSRLDLVNFAVVLDASSSSEQLTAILNAMAEPVQVAGIDVVPEVNGGLALWPDDAETAAGLVDDAVAAAMNGIGIQLVTFHSAKARDDARERFALEQELRHGIANNEFRLNFQPIVDVGASRVVGAEALIRWHHPERGIVPPALFIPAAERSGQIDEIGMWVIREACAQVARWQPDINDPLRVAVNVSARQFMDPRLIGHLTEAIESARIAPDRLEVELTESAAMVDYDHTRITLGRLRDLGVGVAMDDFGTGYASMSYLRKLPFSKLKIDREFVSHVDTTPGLQAIANAIIALSKGLGLQVLAEGTERAEEVAYLRAHGVDLFQGYYFAKPVTAEAFAETVADIGMRLGEGTRPVPLAMSA